MYSVSLKVDSDIPSSDFSSSDRCGHFFVAGAVGQKAWVGPRAANFSRFVNQK